MTGLSRDQAPVRLTSANVGSSAAGNGRSPRGGRFDQKYRSRRQAETSQARCNAPDPTV